MISARQFQHILLQWYDLQGRKHLPWQVDKTPYRVWISEIMLQQTQVATVIPYYARFMQQFPELAILAKADMDTVLHLWAGLGYYSRARNLLKAAQKIVSTYQGQFPNTLSALVDLPGIGVSTAGAILAIAFNQQATILDGNVKRVLARLIGLETPVNLKQNEATLWALAKELTPKQRVADYTQAMMDFGATFCTRSKPSCAQCPLQKHCCAYAKQMMHLIPMKTVTKKIPTKHAAFLIYRYKGEILFIKRPDKGIWANLWSLPEIPGEADEDTIHTYLQQKQVKHYELTKLASFKHTFTHFHLYMHPVLVDITKLRLKIMEEATYIWYNPHVPQAIGMPKPIKDIMATLLCA